MKLKAYPARSQRGNTPPGGWQKETEQAELHEQIRRRAYEPYEQHGREAGLNLDDWVRAESELTQSRKKPFGV